MLTIDDYLDAAKDNQGLRSDRQLGVLLGLKGSAISQFRTKKTFPSDRTMMAIAKFGEQDEHIALINLNIWRNMDNATSVVYSEIMDKFRSAAMLVIGIAIAGGIYFYDAAPASAEVAWYASDYILCKITASAFPDYRTNASLLTCMA